MSKLPPMRDTVIRWRTIETYDKAAKSHDFVLVSDGKQIAHAFWTKVRTARGKVRKGFGDVTVPADDYEHHRFSAHEIGFEPTCWAPWPEPQD